MQVTVTVWPVVPEMEPAVALFEFATCVDTQEFAIQEGTLVGGPVPVACVKVFAEVAPLPQVVSITPEEE